MARLFTFGWRPAAPGGPIVGDSGPNELEGTSGADVILGRGGKDELIGLLGDDVLNGGNGTDKLFGGAGADRFVLSEGADIIKGGGGIDVLDARGWNTGVIMNATGSSKGFPSIAANTLTLGETVGSGTVQKIFTVESFLGSEHNDRIYVEGAGGVLHGNGGNDVGEATGDDFQWYGGTGNDSFSVRGNDARAYGGAGNDQLSAHPSSLGQRFFGGAGNDTISVSGQVLGDAERPSGIFRGGAGDDVIRWAASDSFIDDVVDERYLVYGGGGADTFDFGFFNSGVIQDFQVARDGVDLSVFVQPGEDFGWEELKTQLKAWERGTVLELDTQGTSGFDFYFVDVDPGDFRAENFILDG